ncbi:hypothetical protein, partial [Bacillus cereus]|uniref:hypothetical protein n=1 Tax=Bacillus cereus TaxID=1396 RepID=UPI003F53A191
STNYVVEFPETTTSPKMKHANSSCCKLILIISRYTSLSLYRYIKQLTFPFTNKDMFALKMFCY